MLYLKPTVKAEPLVFSWYAWSYLIPPATAACNIVDRHLTIMESFAQEPNLHIDASQDPRLLGGPFINLGLDYVEKIKDLIHITKESCKDLIELARSLKDFDRLLQSLAEGNSLELLYNKIPNNIRGLIELVYDLNNNSSIRLIEGLLYQKYCISQYQSILLSEVNHKPRAFLLSTPRFEEITTLPIKIGFADERITELFAMRTFPKSKEYINSLFEIPDDKKELFYSFFTENHPDLKEDRNYSRSGVRIRYFGHACVLIQTDSISILFDPIVSYESESSLDRFTYNDIPDLIDYVVITHNHQDHVLFETLIQLRYKIKTIVLPTNQKGALADPSLKLILKSIGFKSLISLDEFEELNLPYGQIIGIPFLGEHSDLNIQTKLAYYINLKGRKLLFLADSSNIDDRLYEYIYKHIGTVDIIFLGMECDGAPLSWLYGPMLSNPLKRSFDNSRTLSGSNFDKAWPIVKRFNCKQAYVYAMGQEPWLSHIMALDYTPESIQMIDSNRFIQKCQENGIYAEKLYAKKEWLV